jgi:hypothetical protein
VVEDVLSSPDRIQGIQGYVGAGKTTTLAAIRSAAESRGYQVEGFAPTGQVSAALNALQLQGRVREIPNAEDRVRAIAKSYVESPENTLIVSPDNASRCELNVAMRQELKANGTLALEDHKFSVLVQRQDMTGADRSWASNYEINDIVRYARGSKTVGIEAATYASVVAINPAENLLTVEKPNQDLATYDPRRLTGVSVYREIEREFSIGDRIQFTAPEARSEEIRELRALGMGRESVDQLSC